MQVKKYFAIYNSEDGIKIHVMSGELIRKRIQPEDEDEGMYYETPYVREEDLPEARSDGEIAMDVESFPQGTMIIKGDIIVPREVEVVTRLEID